MLDDAEIVLADADWADCFRGDVKMPVDTSMEATRILFAKPPAWIGSLLKLRNAIVAPLGLRPAVLATGNTVGAFPIVSSTESRTVLGFDDWHLDFRIVVDLAQAASPGARQLLSVTTLVRRKSIFGRIYIAVVGPFHRRIVPATMASLCSDLRPASVAQNIGVAV